MCRICRWLFVCLPLPALRALLIARHMEGCPACRRRLADDDSLARALPPPAWLATAPDLWPGIAAAIARAEATARRPVPAPRRAWRWAVVSTMVAMLALPLWRMVRVPVAPPAGARPAAASSAAFALLSASIDGLPAVSYIVQTPDSDLVIVWLEKN